MFSAGGNDVLGGGNISSILAPFYSGASARDLIKDAAVQEALGAIREGYETVIQSVKAVSPSTIVMFHGYDYPVPRTNGNWLGKPMRSLGIPRPLQRDIVKILLDRLNDLLEDIAGAHGPGVVYVDCRNVVGTSVNSWFDEIHPKSSGFQRVSELLENKVNDHRLKAGGFLLRLKAGLVRHSADWVPETNLVF